MWHRRSPKRASERKGLRAEELWDESGEGPDFFKRRGLVSRVQSACNSKTRDTTLPLGGTPARTLKERVVLHFLDVGGE
jgi:hypothetical protein